MTLFTFQLKTFGCYQKKISNVWLSHIRFSPIPVCQRDFLLKADLRSSCLYAMRYITSLSQWPLGLNDCQLRTSFVRTILMIHLFDHSLSFAHFYTLDFYRYCIYIWINVDYRFKCQNIYTFKSSVCVLLTQTTEILFWAGSLLVFLE